MKILVFRSGWQYTEQYVRHHLPALVAHYVGSVHVYDVYFGTCFLIPLSSISRYRSRIYLHTHFFLTQYHLLILVSKVFIMTQKWSLYGYIYSNIHPYSYLTLFSLHDFHQSSWQCVIRVKTGKPRKTNLFKEK